jgi:hypothetical protein
MERRPGSSYNEEPLAQPDRCAEVRIETSHPTSSAETDDRADFMANERCARRSRKRLARPNEEEIRKLGASFPSGLAGMKMAQRIALATSS